LGRVIKLFEHAQTFFFQIQSVLFRRMFLRRIPDAPGSHEVAMRAEERAQVTMPRAVIRGVVHLNNLRAVLVPRPFAGAVIEAYRTESLHGRHGLRFDGERRGARRACRLFG
jgi:hypothetical protein